MLVDEVHAAIDEGLDGDVLHDIVGLWEANNLNEELTFDALVEAGKPTPCDDCLDDVIPYDDHGRRVENGWEWYMVRPEIWEAAHCDGRPPQFLCIGCLETRINRRLLPDDFSSAPINEPSWIDSKRLLDRLGARVASS
jgi:hypothetical protein